MILCTHSPVYLEGPQCMWSAYTEEPLPALCQDLLSLLSTIPLPRRQFSFRLSKGGCFLLAVRLAGHTTTKNMLSVSELCSRLSVDGTPMGC